MSPTLKIEIATHPHKRRTEDAGVVAHHCERFGPGADPIGSRLPRDLRADAPPDSTYLLASGDGRHGSPKPSVPATSANTGTAGMAAGPGQPHQRSLNAAPQLGGQPDGGRVSSAPPVPTEPPSADEKNTWEDPEMAADKCAGAPSLLLPDLTATTTRTSSHKLPGKSRHGFSAQQGPRRSLHCSSRPRKRKVPPSSLCRKSESFEYLGKERSPTSLCTLSKELPLPLSPDRTTRSSELDDTQQFFDGAPQTKQPQSHSLSLPDPKRFLGYLSILARHTSLSTLLMEPLV